MATAACARCGAQILWKRLHGQPFAVDLHETTSGKDRYVERGELLLPVVRGSDAAGFVDHRLTCTVGLSRA